MITRTRRDFFKRLAAKNYDWKLLIAVVILCIGGLAFLASALPASYGIKTGQTTFEKEFYKQLIFGIWIGGVAAFILAKIDYHLLFKHRKKIVITALVALLLIFIPMTMADIWAILSSQPRNEVRLAWVESLGFLHYANNTVRWIVIPGVTNLQPSEFAKIGLLIYFAAFLDRFEKFDWEKFKRPLYAFGLSALAIVMQPDLGSVVVITGIILTALWVAKIPTKVIAIIISVMLFFGLIFTFTADYRVRRVETWFAKNYCHEEKGRFLCDYFDVYEDKDDSHQIDSITKAIINGDLKGVGYGQGEFKKTIPEVTTDGIIGVIGEEMGFVFTVLFLSLYVYVFWRGMKIAENAPDVGGKALAAGISVWIIFQALWNVGGMIGMLPMKGLPLPFVSEGGTAMLVNLMAVGILLNISSQVADQKKVQKFKVKRRKFKF